MAFTTVNATFILCRIHVSRVISCVYGGVNYGRRRGCKLQSLTQKLFHCLSLQVQFISHLNKLQTHTTAKDKTSQAQLKWKRKYENWLTIWFFWKNWDVFVSFALVQHTTLCGFWR